MRKKIILALFFIVIFGLTFFFTNMYLNSTRYDFTAQSIHGNVNMKSFDGKYKIVYFGYCFCPDVCPASLSIVGSALDELDAKDVIVLFVTLDPKRDSVEATDEFVKYFYPKDSLGLRLEEDKLKKMAKNYGVKYENINLDGSAMDYSVAHSSSIYLFDKNGKFVQEVSNMTYEDVKKAISNLIKK